MLIISTVCQAIFKMSEKKKEKFSGMSRRKMRMNGKYEG
jgi:hypothetical protein